MENRNDKIVCSNMVRCEFVNLELILLVWEESFRIFFSNIYSPIIFRIKIILKNLFNEFVATKIFN